MLKYGARSKRRQPSGYWFTMLAPLHSNSHNYRPLLRLSLTNLHSFLCHIFCLSSSFTLRAANCVRWSLADDRPRSRRSRFSSFVERWPPRDRWNRHNRWPGCLQDKRLYERPREHGWRTILFSSGRFRRCTGLRAYNRVVTVTRLTLQGKHHLDVSRGFFTGNLFHSFLIRWFVDEAWTVFIAIHCDLRQLLASTFLLRTTNIRNRSRLLMGLFSFLGIFGFF